MTGEFGGALRTIQAQATPVIQKTDELSKTLGRLSSSRAPQFMGALTSSVVSSIPAFQGSSAAMGLMSTAAFGLQRSMVALIGSTGFILLAVSALVALTVAQSSSKKSMEELGQEAATLGSRLIQLKKAGVEATFTQNEFTKKVDEFRKAINDTNITLSFWQNLFIGVSRQLGLAGLEANIWAKAIEASGKATAKAKEELGLLLQSQKDFKKEQDLEALEKWNKGLEVSAGWLAKITNRTLRGPVFPMDTKAFDFGTKALTQDLAELIEKQVNERNRAEREWDKINKERLKAERDIADARARAVDAIASSFASTFADMVISGKSSWDDLLKYWERKLLESAVIKILTDLFSKSGLGGIPIIGGLLDFFGFQSGTSFVPQTGLYKLHQGEAVIPAERNPFVTNTNNNWGGNTFILNLNAKFDENSVRTNLLPILERLGRERSLGF